MNDFTRRSRIEIINDILTASKNGAKKTDVMYRANLSFGQLQRYLSFLVDRGLISNRRNDDGKVRYKTSERGKKVLEKYKELNNLINNRE